MSWPCFWVDEIEETELALRRYVSSTDETRKCPGKWGYHNAQTSIGRVPAVRDAEGYLEPIANGKSVYANDDRWPTKCDACDYEFVDDDQWQVFRERVFRGRHVDGEWSERSLPPGAMLDGFWHPQKGPDGIALVVVLPPAAEDSRGHWWHVDGPSRNNGVAGPGWTRTGDPLANPPTVHVSPSILTGDYHGWLHVVEGRSVLTDPI